MTIWKACMFSSRLPIAVPSAQNTMAMSAMKPSAWGRPARLVGRKPASRQTISTSVPCRIAAVAPPSVRPIMMCVRGTGATSVSFRKPNCRSQIRLMPEKIDENSTVMPMTPGATNCR